MILGCDALVFRERTTMIEPVLDNAGYLKKSSFDDVFFVDFTIIVDIQLNKHFSMLKKAS